MTLGTHSLSDGNGQNMSDALSPSLWLLVQRAELVCLCWAPTGYLPALQEEQETEGQEGESIIYR